jgi:hypothetical protein
VSAMDEGLLEWKQVVYRFTEELQSFTPKEG